MDPKTEINRLVISHNIKEFIASEAENREPCLFHVSKFLSLQTNNSISCAYRDNLMDHKAITKVINHNNSKK